MVFVFVNLPIKGREEINNRQESYSHVEKLNLTSKKILVSIFDIALSFLILLGLIIIVQGQIHTVNATTNYDEINKIEQRLLNFLEGKEHAVPHYMLTGVARNIENYTNDANSSNQVLKLISYTLDEEGISGPTGQALILLTKQWLHGDGNSGDKLETQIADRISNVENITSADQISGALALVARETETGKDHHFDNNYVPGIEDQIYLQIAHKGGNMSKAEENIRQTLDLETITPVSDDILPLHNAMDILNEQSRNNTVVADQIVDNITSLAVKNENRLDVIIVVHVCSKWGEKMFCL